MSFQSIAKAIILDIEKNFSQLEALLLAPSIEDTSAFQAFLKNYRGTYTAASSFPLSKKHTAEQAAAGVFAFFEECFSRYQIETCPIKDLIAILEMVEKAINLALYYWYGCNDRNFQFRTFVHYYQLEGTKKIFLEKEGQKFEMRLSERGFGIGPELLQKDPSCFPISYASIPSTKSIMLQTKRQVYARIRTIQREICLLTDEWEHLNAVAAVEYSVAVHAHETHPGKPETLNRVDSSFKKMTHVRNSLALLCLESFSEFRIWLEKVREFPELEEDIEVELDAANSLLLSALQKIFLPASVSRHRYNTTVLAPLKIIADSLCRIEPEDISARILRQVIASAISVQNHTVAKFDSSLSDIILQAKSHEWSLSFDPSSAIKAFSWCLPSSHHRMLSCLTGICYFKKTQLKTLEIHLLAEIMCMLHMPYYFQEDKMLEPNISSEMVTPLSSQEMSHENQLLNTISSTLSEFLQCRIGNTPQAKEYSSEIIKTLKTSGVSLCTQFQESQETTR